ncbi:hypothetical protein [Streptomyces lomondensis]|uniref:Lipoprotein n=1 Tax=Streptomyces lomondensis TaxID=68229 RepID=A0ABQ2X9Z0_9ACTN|nr:hypothetical protein [Streptomyces lomondensis]MCF0077217.1 hypothetical protein [Streptomyces lomondensis]GGX05802.1 hypothetical protein GCM10010383_39780 [Streptomyces lomondensis]
MRTDMTRTARLLLVLALSAAGAGAAAGCGSTEAGGTEPAPRPRSENRAQQVAEAWDGSRAAAQWRAGYHPMGPVVQLPGTGLLRDDADRRAYEIGNFDLRGKLPAAPGGSGRVTWPSGGSLKAPLMDAEQAYKALDTADSPGPRLTVTGAKPGEMTVATSRGPATVPAWLFTLEGYDSPLKHAAVSPSKLPRPPIRPLGQNVPSDVLAPLGGLTGIEGNSRSVTVMAHHGACDDGPVVEALETKGSVVLSAAVTGVKEGPCTTELRGKRVTVKLDRPVGDRVVLDAFTGRPVPYTAWPGEAHNPR